VITIPALFAGILSVILVPEKAVPTEILRVIAQVVSDIPWTKF
jgi:hypothetical protein